MYTELKTYVETRYSRVSRTLTFRIVILMLLAPSYCDILRYILFILLDKDLMCIMNIFYFY